MDNKKPNLYALAIAILACRDYSEAELTSKLQQKVIAWLKKNTAESELNQGRNYDYLTEYLPNYQLELEQLLARLKAENLLCEPRLAKQYLDSRGKKLGNQRLIQQLKQRGLAAEMIDTSLAEFLNEHVENDEITRAQVVFGKKFTIEECVNNQKKMLAAWRYLQYRGFSSQTINHLLKNLPNTIIASEHDSFANEQLS